LQPATRTVPIVFTSVTDPIWGGLVASLARPGANTTGFTLSEYGLSGKWLELLEEIAPRVMRTAVLRARGEKWSEVALRFCLAKNENLSW
jgi:putative ABC transport system substrate-binding protein